MIIIIIRLKKIERFAFFLYISFKIQVISTKSTREIKTDVPYFKNEG